MKNTKSTGQIRIVKTPEGEAPPAIREAWVGLVLPCLPLLGFLSEQGVLSKKPISHTRRGVRVPQAEALAILKKAKPEAAAWWETKGFPKAGHYFNFADQEIQIISGVTRRRIIEVTDEMRGHPSR